MPTEPPERRESPREPIQLPGWFIVIVAVVAILGFAILVIYWPLFYWCGLHC